MRRARPVQRPVVGLFNPTSPILALNKGQACDIWAGSDLNLVLAGRVTGLSKMAHVRPFKSSDEEAVVQVFRETAHIDLRNHPDSSVLHIGEYLWCRPYVLFHPDWCWVLDDGSGKAVGYILCAPDTASFVHKWRADFLPVLRENGITEPGPSEDLNDKPVHLRRDVFNPEDLLHPDFPNLATQYPAHLHIDIVPTHQGQGFGQKLIAALFQKLLSEGVPGIFLGMSWDNDGAGRFYERLGFEQFGEMNDQNQVGRKGDGVYWVRKFSRDQPV